MKEKLLHYSFLVPALLFLIHQVLQKGFGVNFQLVNSYLDPFCFSAIALPLISIERKLLFKQPKLSLFETVIITLFLCFFSELLLPYFSDKFVQDIWDAVMILLGGFWYSVFSNKITIKENRI